MYHPADFNKDFHVPSLARETFQPIPHTVLERTRLYRRPWTGAQVIGSVTVTEQLLADMETLHHQLEAFFDPQTDMGVAEQLKLTGSFYQLLGYEQPELSESQRLSLQIALATQVPGRRVVPTRLVEDCFAERVELAAKVKMTFPKHRFHPTYKPLHPVSDSSIYGELARDPTKIVTTGKDHQTKYALGYHVDKDVITNREGYLADLVDSKTGVLADDKAIWLFPVVDVAALPEPSMQVSDEIMRAPEVFIALTLLQQANGMAGIRWRNRSDATNEKLYRYEVPEGMDPDSVDMSMIYAYGNPEAVQVAWFEESGRDFVDAWNLNSPGYHPYQREVSNGL